MEQEEKKGRVDEIFVNGIPLVIRGNGYVMIKYEANQMIPASTRMTDAAFTGKGIERWHRIPTEEDEQFINDVMLSMLHHLCAYRDSNLELDLDVSAVIAGDNHIVPKDIG